jgi:hypothetical protein
LYQGGSCQPLETGLFWAETDLWIETYQFSEGKLVLEVNGHAPLAGRILLLLKTSFVRQNDR